MSEQQQQQAGPGGQIQTAGPARIGLARSRHALGAVDAPSSKKQKGALLSFARDEITTVDGKPKCNRCNKVVFCNITRAKHDLLKCNNFLTSEAAQKAADADQDVADALKELK
jgi:hypothetical protein